MDIELLLKLIGGHYLADFALQSPFMADNKKYALVKSVGFHALTAHASVHGLVAFILSQHLGIALLIAGTHWLIDFGKASVLLTDKFPHTKGARLHGQACGLYGLNVDQSLHLLIILLSVIFVA